MRRAETMEKLPVFISMIWVADEGIKAVASWRGKKRYQAAEVGVFLHRSSFQ